MTRKFNQLLVSLGVTITLLANAYPQSARTVMVQSNTGVLLFPTNLWSANAASARSGLSLATHATNPTVPVTSGGSGATNAAGARINFELVWSGLTNTNATDFRSALGLSLAALTNTNNASFLAAVGFSSTNSPSFAGLTLTDDTNSLVLSATASATRTNLGLTWSGLTNTSASGFRSALELSWSALTNTNTTNFLAALFGANTSPVLINTNGAVTSPTNFWSYAPGAVTVQDFTTNVLTSTTNQVTGARNVFVYSFTTNVTGATHTLELPTNASSGDFVTVTHTGPTSSVTAVRVAGTTNNLVNLSQTEEQVRFVYRNAAWRIEPPRALTTPLYFSGSSASANAAASRTNLGIPLAALTNTDVTNFQRAVFAATNAAPAVTTNIAAWVDIRIGTNTNSFKLPLYQ